MSRALPPVTLPRLPPPCQDFLSLAVARRRTSPLPIFLAKFPLTLFLSLLQKLAKLDPSCRPPRVAANTQSPSLHLFVTMKSNAVLLSFYLAPLAWCTPVPIVLVDSLESIPVLSHTPAGQHPPAPVASSRPLHALPQTVFLNDDNDAASADNGVDINNRPVTPSQTDTPSAVLDTPQPVASSYLLGLAKLSGFRRKFGASHVAEEDVTAVESSSIAQMELGMQVEPTAKTTMPSYYPCVTRERGDMLAISLVAIFIFFVAIVETWAIVVNG